MNLKGIKEAIIESPGWRTFFAFVVPIVASIFTGLFVTEVTVAGEIDWASFYKAKSFYGLIAIGICLYLYNKSIYLHDREISRFLDSDYCTAYMRSKCLPEAAEKYKQLIRDGDGGELKQAMDELKRILK
ncbi:hypothetical protein [Marinobacter pelagius]|uniref:hypothetical protein n=1 Tax=Marinobacter pelagius TaxID=379482 RepID=UPI000B89A1DC|nr:hypothetical protein [Marinobacter pelagius]